MIETHFQSDSNVATEPSLSTYTDFRVYLRDVYEFRRARLSTGRRPYTYSTFAAAADIKSPHYLKLIIDGRRNLSEDMIAKFAKALRLSRAETDEFRALVLYGQAVDPMKRNRFLKELADIRSKNALKPYSTAPSGYGLTAAADALSKIANASLGHSQSITPARSLAEKPDPSQLSQSNHSDELAAPSAKASMNEVGSASLQRRSKVPGWIGWVLYAMADQEGVDFDPDALYKLFRIKTSPEEIRAELSRMLEAGGLIEVPEEQPVVAEGSETVQEWRTQIKKGRNFIESPQDMPVETIRKLQSELIYLGIESLFRDSPKEREFGAMTVAMTAQEFEHVRFELRQLRKRLHKDLMVSRESSKGERVYQLNIQLFPVTERVP